MDSLTAFLAALLIFLTIFMVLLSFHFSRIQTKSMETLRVTMEKMSEVNQSQMRLISKTSALLASKDPMTYQMIQSMETPTAPNDLPDEQEDLAQFYLNQYGNAEDEEALNEIERQQFASP